LKSEVIKRYYANGKLLISGEYLVLSGAEALAVPLKMGQWLEVEVTGGEERPHLDWKAWVMGREWFTATILLPEMEVLQSSDPHIAGRLVKIFREVLKMNSGLFEPRKSYSFSTVSNFDHNWGMGSSSALIANLARWAMIDPFDLFHRLNKGSGYDVAAALAEGPILFCTAHNKLKINSVRFMPAFHKQMWFVYRGQKQDTENSLYEFGRLPQPSRQQIEMINYFTGELLHTQHLNQFMQIMAEHEAFISRLLGRPGVKEEYFSDFNGEIKSLGAWGGDMMLAVSELPADYIQTYFHTKGIQTVFDFHSLILS
jgi:mevalonate kinase